MSDPAPERWHVNAGPSDIATLDVPPALGRARRFDVDVAFVVRCPDDGLRAWHKLAVELDGRRQWARRIATSNPGQTDGLDYHVRVDVPAGAPLRVRALTKVSRAARVQLAIEAVEG